MLDCLMRCRPHRMPGPIRAAMRGDGGEVKPVQGFKLSVSFAKILVRCENFCMQATSPMAGG